MALEFPTFSRGGLAEQIKQRTLRSVFKGSVSNNVFYANAKSLGERFSNETGIARMVPIALDQMFILTQGYAYGE